MPSDPSRPLLAQAALIREWLGQLPDEAFGAPSVLPGWDVRLLTGHVLMIFRGLLSALGSQQSVRRRTAGGRRRTIDPSRR